MTDLEITKACAEAIGESVRLSPYGHMEIEGGIIPYDPLHDDAQAMALVKRFGLTLDPAEDIAPFTWRVCVSKDGDWEKQVLAESADLNRAICECVAKICTSTST